MRILSTKLTVVAVVSILLIVEVAVLVRAGYGAGVTTYSSDVVGAAMALCSRDGMSGADPKGNTTNGDLSILASSITAIVYALSNMLLRDSLVCLVVCAVASLANSPLNLRGSDAEFAH
jgi:hypothetical protein